MQQEAARKLRFTAQLTMRTAQQLYESGLITYMRTDSTQLASEAVEGIRSYINTRYGRKLLPDKARQFKTKSKNAQEAHEAIRPTVITQLPEQLKLTAEQSKLYRLIWQRTVACQMNHAVIELISVDLGCGQDNLFRATGSRVAQPGFMLLYQEGSDDEESSTSQEKWLPLLKVGDQVTLNDIINHQHFTEPPPRYSEATLIKVLEEFGIGRPSTYATIISTLKNREYVSLEKRRFHPTDVGRIVNGFLTEHFATYVNYKFTAQLEDQLDAVARADNEWKPLLRDFWQPFKVQIDDVMKVVQRQDVTQKLLDEKCPECGQQLSERLGRNGRFVACSGYPDCRYTRSLDKDQSAKDQDSEQDTKLDRECPECGEALQTKQGKYGKFIACSGYPNCKYVESLQKHEDTGVLCPQCLKGSMLKKRSRRGKVFFSCARYPDCKYAVWHEPINESCPKCQWSMLTKMVTKTKGEQIVCPQKGCDYHK